MTSQKNTEQNIHNGLVAIFDILGYQKILNNNDLRTSAGIIETLLEHGTGLAKSLPKEMPNIKIPFEKIHTRILSDTIILTMPLSEQEYNNWELWHSFLTYCSIVVRFMFGQGLPIRGAISGGLYYLNKDCFAGKPFVDAYQTGKTQNWSGCVISNNLLKKCEQIIAQKKDSFKNLIFKYPVVQKGEKSEIYLAVNWVNLFTKPFLQLNRDVRGDLAKIFSSFKKNVDPKTLSKIHNTEMFMEYVNANLKVSK
jgi:hypothetical protein